ncbi:hypothetical protein [Noviherbaspirillum sp. Root189]|uniref:hypothetical protein n=1 Tax=Noviherbaspirillum sp. Root189 TaxID=1736487 RepID=UPI000715C6E7|nr:hypothetical protein [Noviherbaspirillum sp. Root189]KRB83503.1 hypothetical protein ASE07_23890 [Noviherbaspirillum sp. Root189]
MGAFDHASGKINSRSYCFFAIIVLSIACHSNQHSPGSFRALVGIGVLGTVCHLLLILAFGTAGPAGTVAMMPFTYAQIGIAALVGW